MKVSLLDLSAALVALASTSTTAARLSGHHFNYAAHLGNLSPYLMAPVPYGVHKTLPEDCTVDQVMLVRLTVSNFFFPFPFAEPHAPWGFCFYVLPGSYSPP